MGFKIFNYIALQVMWFVCVAFGSKGHMLWPTVCFALFLAVHFALSPYKKSDLIICAVAMLGGIVLDTVWSATQLIHYGENAIHPIAPVWIAYLWCTFALTLHHCMAWLKKRYVLACLFSAISGPVSFYAATKVGQIEFLNVPLAPVLLAITWGLFVPFLCYIANRTHSDSEQVGVHASV